MLSEKNGQVNMYAYAYGMYSCLESMLMVEQQGKKGLQSNSGPVRICFRLLASRRSDSELVATSRRSYIALLLTAAGAAVKII